MNAGRALNVGTTVVHGATAGSVLFAGTGGVIQQDNASFKWDDANNRLGIGTASPSARLHVSGAVLLSENSFLINTTHTGQYVSVVNVNPRKTGFDTTYFAALAFEPTLDTDSSVTGTAVWGITGNPRIYGSANADYAVGFRGSVQHTSSGIVDTAIQFLANGITKTTGQLRNAYGLYVADLASVGSTLNYAVFTAGTTPSLFTGAITAAAYAVPTGGAFRTGLVAGNTALLQAYDVDGAAYSTFLTLTANDTPTCALSNVTSSTAFNPTASDGSALGTTALMWSDLFLASGSVINWNAGDILLTHAADTLTLTGGRLVVSSASVASGIAISSSSTVNSGTGLSVTSSSTGSFTSGISCSPIRSGTATGWFAGMIFEATLNTDGGVTVTDLWGSGGNARVNGAANVSRADGYRGTVQHTSSGTTGFASGFHAGGITKSAGAITQSANFLGEDNSALGATGHWGCYMKGALMPNYFQGMVAIGNTAQPIATLDVRPNAVASGTPYAFYMDGAAHTTLTSGERSDWFIDLHRTMNIAAGAIATLRTVRFDARTYSFASASTVTDAATIAISGAPIAGTNATITRSMALWVQSGATRMDGRMLNKQGADVASANDLTLGEDGNSFEITGITQVNAITTARWQNGSIVCLLFTSTPTVKHNTAGGAGTVPILLAGAADFAATAGDTLTLLLSEIGGTQAWRQVSNAAI